MTRILYVLLDLPLLPPGCRITELGLEQIMAHHREEAGVDGSTLAAPDLVDRGVHVVIDAAARHPAQHAERVIMGVEQHLMGLQEIGPQKEGFAVAELEVRHLQCGSASKVRPRKILAKALILR